MATLRPESFHRILIRHGVVVTCNPRMTIIPDGFVVIEGNRIAAVGKTSHLPPEYKAAEKIIDARGMAVLPGLISGHTHAGHSLLRGLAEGLKLDAWASKRLLPYRDALSAEDRYVATKLGCLEMVRAGITCFLEAYYDMDAAARAVTECGIRACLALYLMDRRWLSQSENLDRARRFLTTKRDDAADRITPMLAPNSLRVASRELLLAARELADRHKVGLTMHVSEVRADVAFTMTRYGKRPVQYLHGLGMLKRDVVLAHCVHVNANEIDLLRRTGASVIHNPSSNAKLASGVAPVTAMLQRGVTVGLGADAAAANNTLDMFEEMRLAAHLQALTPPMKPARLPPDILLRMATVHNARALGLEHEVGSLEPNKKADVILLNLRQPHFAPIFPERNLLPQLVFAASGRDVDTTICDGVVLMEHRRVTFLDDDAFLALAHHRANDLLQKMDSPAARQTYVNAGGGVARR